MAGYAIQFPVPGLAISQFVNPASKPPFKINCRAAFAVGHVNTKVDVDLTVRLEMTVAVLLLVVDRDKVFVSVRVLVDVVAVDVVNDVFVMSNSEVEVEVTVTGLIIVDTELTAEETKPRQLQAEEYCIKSVHLGPVTVSITPRFIGESVAEVVVVLEVVVLMVRVAVVLVVTVVDLVETVVVVVVIAVDASTFETSVLRSVMVDVRTARSAEKNVDVNVTVETTVG